MVVQKQFPYNKILWYSNVENLGRMIILRRGCGRRCQITGRPGTVPVHTQHYIIQYAYVCDRACVFSVACLVRVCVSVLMVVVAYSLRRRVILVVVVDDCKM